MTKSKVNISIVSTNHLNNIFMTAKLKTFGRIAAEVISFPFLLIFHLYLDKGKWKFWLISMVSILGVSALFSFLLYQEEKIRLAIGYLALSHYLTGIVFVGVMIGALMTMTFYKKF